MKQRSKEKPKKQTIDRIVLLSGAGSVSPLPLSSALPDSSGSSVNETILFAIRFVFYNTISTPFV